jgi:hypothetical protein
MFSMLGRYKRLETILNYADLEVYCQIGQKSHQQCNRRVVPIDSHIYLLSSDMIGMRLPYFQVWWRVGAQAMQCLCCLINHICLQITVHSIVVCPFSSISPKKGVFQRRFVWQSHGSHRCHAPTLPCDLEERQSIAKRISWLPLTREGYS